MTTFGVDLTTHADESGEEIPYIVNKCIAEVEDKGYCMKVSFYDFHCLLILVSVHQQKCYKFLLVY